MHALPLSFSGGTPTPSRMKFNSPSNGGPGLSESIANLSHEAKDAAT